MSEVTRDEFENLRATVAKHEALLKDHAPVLDDHEDRLDAHDRVLSVLTNDLADVKRDLRSVASGMDRAINTMTALLSSSELASKVLDRIASQVANVHKRLEGTNG